MIICSNHLTFSLCNPRSDILGCAELTTPSRWRFCKVSPSWCKPLEKSPCWGASSPLPKKSRTRLPFFGLVLASGLSLLCCVCWNSIYPAFLLMFPDTAWARIGAAFTDAALDLGYILTYLGMASLFKFGLTSFTGITVL